MTDILLKKKLLMLSKKLEKNNKPNEQNIIINNDTNDENYNSIRNNKFLEKINFLYKTKENKTEVSFEDLLSKIENLRQINIEEDIIRYNNTFFSD